MTMDDLLARGRAAYGAFLARRYPNPDAMPLGVTGVSVVTRQDFDAYPTMCREYATTVRTLHVLDARGNIEVLVCKSQPRDP